MATPSVTQRSLRLQAVRRLAVVDTGNRDLDGETNSTAWVAEALRAYGGTAPFEAVRAFLMDDYSMSVFQAERCILDGFRDDPAAFRFKRLPRAS